MVIRSVLAYPVINGVSRRCLRPAGNVEPSLMITPFDAEEDFYRRVALYSGKKPSYCTHANAVYVGPNG